MMADNITITFHGHSSFSIEYGSYHLLIDPFISENPVAVIDAESLDPTHIILTHGHGDHLGDTLDIAKRSGAQAIVTYEVANYLKEEGLEDVLDLAVGGGRDVDFGRVTFTIAHHGSAHPDGRYMGVATGVVIGIGGCEFYHAGDTALTYDMRLIDEFHDIDVAMVPIGDNYTMGIPQAIRAVEFVGAAAAIPMHYNTFDPIKADPDAFAEGVRKLGATPVILSPGQTHTVQSREG